MNVEITSEAFAEGARIPRTYTCEGEDVSPQLSWGEAGTWVTGSSTGFHPTPGGLRTGVPTSDALPSGARQGTNDFGPDWVWRPLSATRSRHSSVLLQALRAGYRGRPGTRRHQERPARRYGRPHPGIGPAYGDLREVVARLKICGFADLPVLAGPFEGRVARGPRLVGGQQPATATSSRYAQVTAWLPSSLAWTS